jgi:RimJ/RimL family protein N-acetyltransferase
MLIHRLATAHDAVKIINLYYEVYQGLYPDPVMRDFSQFLKFVQNKNNYWFISEETNLKKIVSSVIYRYQEENLLAKVYGAVVDPTFRGAGLIRELMSFGENYLKANTQVELIYATTRTVHNKAQLLTEKLGYKKLGIFPNVHKTDEYETHCLTASHGPAALKKRFSQYKIHHQLKSLTDIACKEMDIPLLESITPKESSKKLLACPRLETFSSSHAKEFIWYRYNLAKKEKHLSFEFFPFQEPNFLLSSADQKLELFLNYSENDGHVDFLGAKVFENLSYESLFTEMGKILKNYGARYIELMIRAHQPKVIESVLKARFVPSAFLPAFQLTRNLRYDFIVMSRSFQVLDFQNLILSGSNNEYLKIYYKAWKKIMLGPSLLEL